MLFTYMQKPSQTNEAFKEEFEALWDTFEQQGGCMWRHPGLIDDRALVIARENGRANETNGVPQANADDIAEAEA